MVGAGQIFRAKYAAYSPVFPEVCTFPCHRPVAAEPAGPSKGARPRNVLLGVTVEAEPGVRR